jgi:hypothetical protein
LKSSTAGGFGITAIEKEAIDALFRELVAKPSHQKCF